MPTEVFRNLNEQKQKLLRDKLYETFSKYSFHKININLISKELGITRTAFYYYFQDKNDVYEYLVSYQKEKFIKEYIFNRDDKIDFLELLNALFDFLASYKNTVYQGFFEELSYSIDYHDQSSFLELITKNKELEHYSHFAGFNKYRMETHEEKIDITRILFLVVFNHAIHFYNSDKDLEIAKKELDKKFDFLFNGLIKDQYRGENYE